MKLLKIYIHTHIINLIGANKIAMGSALNWLGLKKEQFVDPILV